MMSKRALVCRRRSFSRQWDMSHISQVKNSYRCRTGIGCCSEVVDVGRLMAMPWLGTIPAGLSRSEGGRGLRLVACVSSAMVDSGVGIGSMQLLHRAEGRGIGQD